jgi:hypothetical protein
LNPALQDLDLSLKFLQLVCSLADGEISLVKPRSKLLYLWRLVDSRSDPLFILAI